MKGFAISLAGLFCNHSDTTFRKIFKKWNKRQSTVEKLELYDVRIKSFLPSFPHIYRVWQDLPTRERVNHLRNRNNPSLLARPPQSMWYSKMQLLSNELLMTTTFYTDHGRKRDIFVSSRHLQHRGGGFRDSLICMHFWAASNSESCPSIRVCNVCYKHFPDRKNEAAVFVLERSKDAPIVF